MIVAALVASLSLAAGPTDRVERHGVSAPLPVGWHVVHERLTPCTNPVERLTLAGRGALVMLQESLDRAYVNRFETRPVRFRLRGEPQFITCCAPTGRGRGWFLNFRDGGRAFYAYVYLGRAGTRAQALAILDGLRIRPRA